MYFHQGILVSESLQVSSPITSPISLNSLLHFPYSNLALVRQTNSNWKAFYVLTEKPVFSKMLRAILNSYNDGRLNYLPVDGRLLTKVSACFVI